MFKTGTWCKRVKFLVKFAVAVSFTKILDFVQEAFECYIKKIESANFYKK